jgi:Domain of unknown function (DUF932)
MKTGLNLTQMAAELERREAAKRDFIADTAQLTIDNEARVEMNLGGNTPAFSPTEHFRRQMATHFKVPAEYAERIRTSHPDLYAGTFNTFLHRERTKRMVRTLDGTARAFLSDRYRPLDNHDLAMAVLPELMDRTDMTIESTEFTETRFYIKAVSKRLTTEVKRGDAVQMGLVISNSEVGAGALKVEPLIYRLVCLNGMIMPDYGTRKAHLGRREVGVEDAFELFTDKTRQLDDAAFFSKVRDTVTGLLSMGTLEKIVAKMREATEQELPTTDIPGIVELTGKRFGYNEQTRQGILSHLITGGDLTRYGLMNALTRQSQDEADYELATQLEADGGRIIELNKTDWRSIVDATPVRKAA